jgi:hypothetical protein
MARPKPPAPPAEVLAWRTALKPMKRHGSALQDQQFWCWGFDIREQGNLFLRYGFNKYSQDKSCGGSVYSLVPTDGVSVRLWGGTLIYCDVRYGQLHIKRHDFEPRLLPEDYVPAYALPEGSHTADTAEACQRVAALASDCWRWIAAYERWVLDEAGLLHRQRAVSAWKSNAVMLIEAEQMAAMWAGFADEVSRLSFQT